MRPAELEAAALGGPSEQRVSGMEMAIWQKIWQQQLQSREQRQCTSAVTRRCSGQPSGSWLAAVLLSPCAHELRFLLFVRERKRAELTSIFARSRLRPVAVVAVAAADMAAQQQRQQQRRSSVSV